MSDGCCYSSKNSDAKRSDPRQSFASMIEVTTSSHSSAADENKTDGNSKSAEYTPEDAVNSAGLGTFQVKLVLLSCFIWMFQGFGSVFRMFVSPLISCKWNLWRWQSALLHTTTTLSLIFGCLCHGICADKYGRRTVLCSSLVFVFIFGAVSSVLPSYAWFISFRTMAAFSGGGLAQALTLVCECVPKAQRGRSVFILSSSFGAGVMLMLGVLYATAVQPKFRHWRLFVAAAAIPSGVAMAMMQVFPESVRFLLSRREDGVRQATAIAEEMASLNKRHLPSGTMVQATGRGPRLYTTLLFCCMGLATSTAYYSMEATTDRINQAVEFSNVNSGGAFVGELFQPVPCLRNMTEERFVDITWNKAVDFSSFVVFLLIVDEVGRRVLLGASFLFASLFTLLFLLSLPTQSILMKMTFLFCARTLLMGQTDLLLLMAGEAYPTTERGAAVGRQAAMTVLGYLLNPYIFWGFGLRSLFAFYASILFVCGTATIFLPAQRKTLTDVRSR